MVNTFVQYDPDTLQITAILQGEETAITGYIKLKQPLPPPPADSTLVLRLNYQTATCFYDKSDEAYQEFRMSTLEEKNEELSQQNDRLTADIRDLQDIIMYLMMS